MFEIISFLLAAAICFGIQFPQTREIGVRSFITHRFGLTRIQP
jgi:hypothetical protein